MLLDQNYELNLILQELSNKNFRLFFPSLLIRPLDCQARRRIMYDFLVVSLIRQSINESTAFEKEKISWFETRKFNPQFGNSVLTGLS